MNNKINRYGTFSSKWDEPQQRFNHTEMIHMAVADMDLETSPAIKKAIIDKANKGILGYTYFSQEAKENIAFWMKEKHQVTINTDWIVFIPRVSIAASIFVEQFTNPLEKVIINTPTYPPLKYAITANNRYAVDNKLLRSNNCWQLDFKQLENLIDERTKAMIFVNPDNPSGRAWTRNELNNLAEIMIKNDLLLFSDEVHSDILSDFSRHTTMLNISNEMNQRLIYAGSISKTFNVPGLIISYLIIPNQEIRNKFNSEIKRIGMNNPPVFTNEVIHAAYHESNLWLEQILEQVNENEQILIKEVKSKMPRLKVLKREATYLSLIDFSHFNISDENILKWFEQEAHLTVYSGLHFGDLGKGLIRLNLATDSTTFRSAVERMVINYNKIKEYENETI